MYFVIMMCKLNLFFSFASEPIEVKDSLDDSLCTPLCTATVFAAPVISSKFTDCHETLEHPETSEDWTKNLGQKRQMDKMKREIKEDVCGPLFTV